MMAASRAPGERGSSADKPAPRAKRGRGWECCRQHSLYGIARICVLV